MKKTLLSTVLVGLSVSVLSVFAETGAAISVTPTLYTANPSTMARAMSTGDVNVPSISTVNPVIETTPTFNGYTQESLQARAVRLISNRVSSLNDNAEVINENKKLSDEQKTALNTIISTNITGLTALGNSIASSSDPAATKTLVKSIYTDFRIFAIVIPKVRIEKRIYDLQNHAQNLSDLFVQTQTKIDAAKAEGKNVDAWQANLDNAKIRVATDLTLLTSVFTKIDELSPANYNVTHKTVITQANATLKSIVTDFNYVTKSVRQPVGTTATGSSAGGVNIYHQIRVGEPSPYGSSTVSQ